MPHITLAGRPDEALVQYEEAIRLEPGAADADYNAGNALTRLGPGFQFFPRAPAVALSGDNITRR